jgi:apolipoprotein N-acyltransferase
MSTVSLPSASKSGFTPGWVEIGTVLALVFLGWMLVRAHVLSAEFIRAFPLAATGFTVALALFKVVGPLLLRILPRRERPTESASSWSIKS